MSPFLSRYLLMRIGLKLTAAFLSIASLVGVVGYLAHTTNREVEQNMDRLSRSAIVKVADATDITAALYAGQLAAHALLQDARARINERSPSLPSADRHGNLQLHQSRVSNALARQNQVVDSIIRWAEEKELDKLAERERTHTLESLRQLQEECAIHKRTQDEFLAMVDRDPGRAELFLENRLCGHFESQLLPQLNAYREQAEQELTQAVRATERAIVVAEQRRSLLIVVAAAGAVLMGLFTSRIIGRPLTELQQAAQEVGRGRFDVRVSPRSRDEIGSLAASINQMAVDLQQTTVSRGYLDNIIQSMREMLIVADPELKIRHVNPAACTELQCKQDDLENKTLRDLFGPEEFSEQDNLPEILAPGIECLVQDVHGTLIPVHCSAAKMNDAKGELDGYVCVASNISRQKEAERQLVDSLKEKELLLKEVHHRVKNNLQVISSLLNLQARELHDPGMARLFLESQGRIRSMALIHEQLYRSSDLARIDFAAYVQDLVRHLEQGLSNETVPVCFRLDIRPLPLSLDLAIPCGMILNELVSNAQKHAFPPGQTGEICVVFDSDSKGYFLTVADNGVGIQNGIDSTDASSLGLKVVQALIRQIRGKLDVRREQGTNFTIRFNPEHNELA